MVRIEISPERMSFSRIICLRFFIKKSQTKTDSHLCAVERSIPIPNKSDSLPAIILLDPVTQEKNLRGMGKINVEHWWRRVVLSLLTAKWNNIVCIVNCQPINWILGWEPKNQRVLTFHPVTLRFYHTALLLQPLQGLSYSVWHLPV